MTLTGGKRKVNKSLKSWVAFVKRVQKEEKLNYKDAIHRAKVRKDKGEKWMVGGANIKDSNLPDDETVKEEMPVDTEDKDVSAKEANEDITGGKRRTRSRRGGKSMKRKGGKTKRRSRRH